MKLRSPFRRLVAPALACFIAALAFPSCSGETDPAKKPVPATTPTPDTLAAKEIRTPEVHHAMCGCALPEVAHCGNYVSLEGRYVPIVWPELEIMQWCDQGKAGADIEITGAMKDGKFVATSLKPKP